MKFTIPCRILTLLFGLSPLSALAANLDQTLSSQPNLSTFRSLVSSNPTIFSNLPQGITILAPNDDAFNRIGNWHSQISSNKTFVSAILKYHILPKEVSMKPIPRGESTWSNTLLTDQGFSTIMGGQRLIMTKLPDEKVVFTSGFATRGTVVTEDIQFDGGLIQVVDGVMRVPAGLEFTMRRSFPDDISAFLGGLFASGLMEELVGKTNDVTIFAPHNSAFQHLASNFEGMKTEEVKKIFRYHIVPGTVSHSWELQDGSSFKTAETGKKIAITLHTNFIFVNSAQVLQSDVLLSNGVVHIIDNVLDPNHQSSKPDMNLVSQTPVFEVKGTKTETGRGVETPWIGWIPCLEGEEGCRRVTVTAVPTTTPTGTGTGTGTGTATGTVRDDKEEGGWKPSQVPKSAGVRDKMKWWYVFFYIGWTVVYMSSGFWLDIEFGWVCLAPILYGFICLGTDIFYSDGFLQASFKTGHLPFHQVDQPYFSILD